ncbi:hypothetical protein BDK92_4789 [Micromonospora pisi]|uniref:Uncharacterized protein n=1 Tax=Micromonospora pisi TaxID=589240 RepID=A0A495JN68_9ACTN|nr:hypothetical protein [Micromonospora pisi]RKR90417.1 hypothetical protein BDK92_4789 [Micromonospora pisi]
MPDSTEFAGTERVTGVDRWLQRLRGAVAPRRHNARTIAALTGNPGCHRRAVLDAAGVDKPRLAEHIGFPARFGQSRFAITRGNAFEAQVKADGGVELLRLLRERLGRPIPYAAFTDLDDDQPASTPEPAATTDTGPDESNEQRYERSQRLLSAAAREPASGDAVIFDHPLLRLRVAGQPVYLEPDLIAFRVDGRFHVVEIKSFPVIDGQADPSKVSAAAIQAAVYVLAMRQLLTDAGHDPEIVSHDVLLVCPRDFTNEPVAALVDVRKQLSTLRRQLTRMARVEELVAALPPDLTFDLAPDRDGRPTRSPAALTTALDVVEARYAPECLASCELAFYCRHEARGHTGALGRSVREELGGVEQVPTVLALANGELAPAEGQAEAAALLQAAARLRAEALS